MPPLSRSPLVYFANRFKNEAQIDQGDIAYMTELLGDLKGAPADLLLETNGGQTDATEAVVSLLKSTVSDLRVDGRMPEDVKKAVHALSTKNVFFSHGSVIDHREAVQLGLKVLFLDGASELWQRLWLLHCMYSQDMSAGGYLKVFEGVRRSTTVAPQI